MLSQREVGLLLGISGARVQQLENRAMRKILMGMNQLAKDPVLAAMWAEVVKQENAARHPSIVRLRW